MENGDLRRNSESGQTMAEYAVILTMITVTIVASFTLLGNAAASALNGVVSMM
jgi:Flp pilus assembly pilin Flp